MKKLILLFLILFPLLPLKCEETLRSLSLRARTLWDARDYSGAGAIYEKLLLHPLPSWQKARLHYNLGTIRISQFQPAEALHYLQMINPVDLSLPEFARDFYLNLGIAYGQYAQTISFDQQSYFFEQSLKALSRAGQLECELQKSEDAISKCLAHPQIQGWTDTIRSKLEANLSKGNDKPAEELSTQSETAPINILKMALKQSRQSARSFFQSELMAEEPENKAGLKPNPSAEQRAVLTAADPFILAVLNEQKKSFSMSHSGCLTSSWDGVIVHYDQGYRSALYAEEGLSTTAFDPLEIAALQEQTIKEWEKALYFLLHPPPKKEKKPAQNEAPTKGLEETFRLIQEMYLQDQHRAEQVEGELHSW